MSPGKQHSNNRQSKHDWLTLYLCPIGINSVVQEVILKMYFLYTGFDY